LIQEITQGPPTSADPSTERVIFKICHDPESPLSKIDIFSELGTVPLAHQPSELLRVEDLRFPKSFFPFDSFLQTAEHPVRPGIEIKDELPPVERERFVEQNLDIGPLKVTCKNMLLK
jgi:hypothetical protein